MSGPVSALMTLLCQSGCNPGAVISALSFHPPKPPYYQIVENIEDGKKSLTLADDVHPVLKFATGTIRVERLVDKSEGCDIPLVAFLVPNAKYTLLYSHGNATDIGGMYNRLCSIAQTLGINVIGYDYTGYGVSEGVASESQTYRDIARVVKWLINNSIVTNPNTELILYGQSVGSGPSCFFASNSMTCAQKSCGYSRNDIKVAGLIIHSGILSGLRVFTESRLLGCFDPFVNIDRIKNVQCPVFIIHGTDDEEVPYHHGKGLYDALPDEYARTPWWVPNRGHNDVLVNNETEFFFRLREFVSSLSEDVPKDGITIEGRRISYDSQASFMDSAPGSPYPIGSPYPGSPMSPLPVEGGVIAVTHEQYDEMRRQSNMLRKFSFKDNKSMKAVRNGDNSSSSSSSSKGNKSNTSSSNSSATGAGMQYEDSNKDSSNDKMSTVPTASSSSSSSSSSSNQKYDAVATGNNYDSTTSTNEAVISRDAQNVENNVDDINANANGAYENPIDPFADGGIMAFADDDMDKKNTNNSNNSNNSNVNTVSSPSNAPEMHPLKYRPTMFLDKVSAGEVSGYVAGAVSVVATDDDGDANGKENGI